MRRTHQTLLALSIAGLVVVPAASAKQTEFLQGDFQVKGQGVEATVAIDEFGDAEADYSLKGTPCGSVKGSIDLDAAPGGSAKGKHVSGKKTVSMRVDPGRKGSDMTGSIKYVVITGKDDDEQTCKVKRTFTGELDSSSSDLVKSSTGHYTGVGDDGGLPVSFDVSYSKSDGELMVKNLAFQTDTECWEDLDNDGEDDSLVANITGLSGEVDADGDFEIDYTPDDDTEYYVEGTIEDGEADMYIEVGGYFGDDGNPAAGPHECDSWGEDYSADKGA